MKISFLKIVLVLVLGVFCLSPFVASADFSDNMDGFAWSSTIGWISFNCTYIDTCGTSSYGVNKDENGNLVGYAWSSNIGWIQFGGLSGFPTGTGTTASNAKVVGGSLVGWAKALSGGDGSSGWDGWISLAGTAYGVTLTNNNFSGFAWGDEVVGWVNFDGVIVGVLPTINLTASSPSPTTAVANIPSTFTSTITNSGNASASGPITHLFQYDNDGGHASGVTSIPVASTAISAGGAVAVSNDYTFTTGTRYVRVCADKSSTGATGTVDEINENDNCSAWTAVIVSSTPFPVNGACSLPAIHYTCDSGASMNNAEDVSVYTWDCLGSNGGSDALGCSETKIPATVSACSSPMIHYTCDDGSDGTAKINSPTKWAWTCGVSSCSEKKTPGYTEN